MQRLVGTAVLAALIAVLPTAASAESRTYDVEPFTEIEISSGIDATIAIGDTRSVVAESANSARLDELIVEVSGGRLHARFDWDVFDLFSLGESGRVQVTITVPQVEAIDSNSGADVSAAGLTGERLSLSTSSGADLDARNIDVDTVVLEASSGGDLDVSGACTSARAEASSGADLDARDLVCADVDVEASSGASAEVNATRAARAEASSGASIDIHGAPADLKTDESSGGDVNLRS